MPGLKSDAALNIRRALFLIFNGLQKTHGIPQPRCVSKEVVRPREAGKLVLPGDAHVSPPPKRVPGERELVVFWRLVSSKPELR